jgi:uncharacterized protein
MADTRLSETPDAGADSLGSSLCTRCGLCCTGALHDRALLDSDEIAHAEGLGLPVRVADRPVFALPCPKLAGTLCSIYADRPRVCSRYKCQLLLDVEAGAVTLDAALATVAEARVLADLALEAMPEPMGFPEARVLVDRTPNESASDETLSRLSRLKLALTIFSLYLDRNFRKEKEGTLLLLEPVELRKPSTKVL